MTSRRSELLSIAMRLFAEQGVANTSVRQIAEEAGILSGSLYHHFDSKEQMVAEAVGTGMAHRMAMSRSVIDESANSAVALYELITRFVHWVGQEPDAAKILSVDKAYIRDTPALADTEAARQRGRLTWIDLVERGVDEGVFRQGIDADIVVRSIFDGMYGSVRWMYGDDAAPDTVAHQLAAFYVRGLLADGYEFDGDRLELVGPS
ncbi:MAG: TetR/AcrR family transcriptional regulator [Acidimicrobiales bacterium]